MPEKKIQKAALSLTRWIGSPASIIVHTGIFIASFMLAFGHVVDWTTMLLVLTTIVSLEAIYLSIFIQMTINYTSQELEEVGEDIEEMQEDIGEIQEDVDELQEDVEDISEEVEEMSEEEQLIEAAEETRKTEQRNALNAIQKDLNRLLSDIERLKNTNIEPKNQTNGLLPSDTKPTAL